ncbi:hypothetical protein ACTTAI_00705 (plasmid) [Rhodobacter capsulatus]|uniref:hypothetical protein n=1 Tax=Rhodobacter capsulatus TaxID=1061 RepID=UPI00402585C8
MSKIVTVSLAAAAEASARQSVLFDPPFRFITRTTRIPLLMKLPSSCGVPKAFI